MNARVLDVIIAIIINFRDLCVLFKAFFILHTYCDPIFPLDYHSEQHNMCVCIGLSLFLSLESCRFLFHSVHLIFNEIFLTYVRIPLIFCYCCVADFVLCFGFAVRSFWPCSLFDSLGVVKHPNVQYRLYIFLYFKCKTFWCFSSYKHIFHPACTRTSLCAQPSGSFQTIQID